MVILKETPLFIIQTNWDNALSYLTGSLEEKGFQVLRSFDLQVARSVHANCSCSHHGTGIGMIESGQPYEDVLHELTAVEAAVPSI